MRKFLLSLLLLVVFSPLALRADEVVVGTADGTSTLVVPFRNNQTASYTQSVYPKEEVGGAMTELRNFLFERVHFNFFSDC